MPKPRLDTYSPSVDAGNDDEPGRDVIVYQDAKFPWYEIGEWIAERTGTCATGSWTLRYADAIWIECHCCYAIRATLIGGALGTAIGVILGAVVF